MQTWGLVVRNMASYFTGAWPVHITDLADEYFDTILRWTSSLCICVLVPGAGAPCIWPLQGSTGRTKWKPHRATAHTARGDSYPHCANHTFPRCPCPLPAHSGCWHAVHGPCQETHRASMFWTQQRPVSNQPHSGFKKARREPQQQ